MLRVERIFIRTTIKTYSILNPNRWIHSVLAFLKLHYDGRLKWDYRPKITTVSQIYYCL